MKLKPDQAKQLAGILARTHPDEMGCEDCYEALDHFVEMVLAGQEYEQAMPLVHEHLERCPECREEYEALLAALRSNP